MRFAWGNRITLLVAALVWFPCASRAAEEGWQHVGEVDGIEMYRRQVPGNPVVAYRATGEVDAPVGKVLTLVLDTPHKKEWISRVKDSRIVREVSPTERVEYMQLSAPWPVSDRDVLYHAKLEFDEAKQAIRIVYESVEDPALPPQKGFVRAQILSGKFWLRPGASAARTWAEVETHVDPKGSIPKWVVNLVQKKAPKQSIEQMLERIRKQDVASHPLAAKYFGEKVASR